MKKVSCAVLLLIVVSQIATAGLVLDLTAVGSSGVINDAVFMQINPTQSAGTGVFNTFLRIQKNGDD